MTHRGTAGSPPSRAHLPMPVGELEGLHQPQGFLHRPAHGEVIEGHLPQHALVVNDEEASEGHALVLEVHAVVLGYFLGEV